jgi:hypothetical protein
MKIILKGYDVFLKVRTSQMEKWNEEFAKTEMNDRIEPDLTPDEELDKLFEIMTYTGSTIRNYKLRKRFHEITISEPRFELLTIKLEGKNDLTIDLMPYFLRGVQELSQGFLYLRVRSDEVI